MTTNIGDLQLIGLRRFGQVWAEPDPDIWAIVIFDGPPNRGVSYILADGTIADANKLIPATPPEGFAGYLDTVNFVPALPTLGSWPQESRPAETLGFFTHTESSQNYWLLAGLDGFVMAFPSEVILVAPPP
jgi:hypothetical protein